MCLKMTNSTTEPVTLKDLEVASLYVWMFPIQHFLIYTIAQM